jgi:hypothetical protein
MLLLALLFIPKKIDGNIFLALHSMASFSLLSLLLMILMANKTIKVSFRCLMSANFFLLLVKKRKALRFHSSV